MAANVYHAQPLVQPVASRLHQFDPQWLAAEYRKLEPYPWMRHPANHLHDNAWYALPLVAVDGAMANMIAMVGECRPTPALLETQAFKPVLDFFQGPYKRVRLLWLQAGGSIREHTDDRFYGEQETVNIHVPIHTNNDVQFVVGGRQFHMSPGECWCIDTFQTHSVSNRGSTDRIHLVMHCVINPFITELLAKAPLSLYSHGDTSGAVGSP